ncbi:lipase [Nocardia cyriacigeorgica]|nr:lipase [Nocardia cyriacigeorgica]
MMPTTSDAFYASPALNNSARPGTILRSRAVTAAQFEQADRAWQLVYSSRTSFGAPIPASGTVLAPAGSETTGGAPILAYYPSFHGLGGRCAPSQLLAGDGTEPDARFIGMALDCGWTVVVPDGHGLGMTGIGPHVFLAGRAAAHAVLDLVRAARTLPDLDAGDAPCVVWGYADGGRAAIWAAEHQPHYAPELDLRGVAAGGVLADPAALLPAVDGGPWAGLALAGFIGLARAYSHLPVGHLITDAGMEVINHAQTLDAAALLVTYSHQPLGAICERTDPWHDPMWRHILDNETSARHTPAVPVHLYHGRSDGIVPVAGARDVFNEYRAFGVEVSWREYGTGHVGASAAGAEESVARLATFLDRSVPSAT